MSEKITQEVVEVGEGHDEVKETDWQSEVEKLKSANARLLEESQKYKTRSSEVDEARKKLAEYERAKLEEEGNWQEMLRLEKENTAKLKSAMEGLQSKTLKANVFNAVANEAKDAYDVNDLLAQSEFSKMIEYDEDALEPSKESVVNFVNSLKQQKSYLFKGKSIAAMADTKPAIDKPTIKPLSQMTKDEVDALRKAKLQANN